MKASFLWFAFSLLAAADFSAWAQSAPARTAWPLVVGTVAPTFKTKDAAGWAVDLLQAIGAQQDVLLVPATYVIGRNGRIKHAYFNLDYKLRGSVRHVAAAL